MALVLALFILPLGSLALLAQYSEDAIGRVTLKKSAPVNPNLALPLPMFTGIFILQLKCFFFINKAEKITDENKIRSKFKGNAFAASARATVESVDTKEMFFHSPTKIQNSAVPLMSCIWFVLNSNVNENVSTERTVQ